MLDILNALVLGAVIAVDIMVLCGLADMSWRARRWASALLVLWASLIVAGAAFGRFTPGSPGLVIPPPAIFAGAIIVLSVIWFASPAFRRALVSIPMYALIGVHALRVLGIFFVLMYAAHRLPFPFAPFAGWGDIITGVDAIPLAIFAARGIVNKPLVTFWNAFGALDLFTALTLGAVTPGMEQITHLPSVLIPGFLVPLYLLSHLTIATQLRMRSKERARSLQVAVGM